MKRTLSEWIEDRNFERKTTMNTNYDDIHSAKEHLSRRLRRITDDNLKTLEEEYGLRRVYPKNLGQLIEWIKEDNFDLDPKLSKESCFTIEYMNWGKIPRDETGFKTAKDTLLKSRQAVEDTIIIHTPDKGLEAVVAFEGTTFH